MICVDFEGQRSRSQWVSLSNVGCTGMLSFALSGTENSNLDFFAIEGIHYWQTRPVMNFEVFAHLTPLYFSEKSVMVTISTSANVVCRHTAFVGVDTETKVPTFEPHTVTDIDERMLDRVYLCSVSSSNLMSYRSQFISAASCSLAPARQYKKSAGMYKFYAFPSSLLFRAVSNGDH